MEKRLTYAIGTLLLGLAPGAMAEESAPQQDAVQGERFVWVKEISGRDPQGNEQRLFSDHRGALLALHEIANANRLINPALIEGKMRYSELRVRLAEKMLVVDASGMHQHSLPAEIGPELRLQDAIEAEGYELITSASPQAAGKSPERVALLKD